jgi:ABC-type transport system involved in multi-copper enzyme maturation permease subunit
MTLRFGPGPVFVFESLRSARRWQVYAGRSAFVLLLLAGMTFSWLAFTPAFYPGAVAGPSYQVMAKIGEWFFFALTGIQISLVLLAAPAAAAGSLGTDRARGTLLEKMVTDLSDAEIVLGTLGARLAPVAGMIVAATPVTALAALLGGVDYRALGGALVVSLALALLGIVLAITLSVWVTRTHEVLMAVYIAEGLWLLAAPVWDGLPLPGGMGPPAWFWKANPYVLAFAPYQQPGYAAANDFAGFGAGALVLSAALVGLAIVCLRPVVVGQSGRRVRSPSRRWAAVVRTIFPSFPGPALDGNPVLWREWHRNRPSRLAWVLTVIIMGLAWALAALGTYVALTDGPIEGAGWLEGSLMFLVTFGLLILSATAPTTLAEERTRGSLDVLLATPLATRAIVVAKWWGVYRRVLAMLPLFLFVAVFLAATMPDLPFPPGNVRTYPPIEPLTPSIRVVAALWSPADFLASAAFLVSLGVALATWLRRVGRAITLSVIAFFVLGLAWPILAEISFDVVHRWLEASNLAPNEWFWTHRVWVDVLGALSPIFGPWSALNALRWNIGKGTPFWIGLGVVIALKAAAAWLLLWLTILTFDRCLGRVPEGREVLLVSLPRPRP